jgi:lipopolysaccharide export system permease protein
VIIFRYIARDLFGTTVAVCAVLMLVIISGRFVKYLAEAAAGMLDANILFAVIGYRLPGFLELILPLAFFLGILLVYGRLYVDSEMTVLYACGMSPSKLIVYTMVVAVFVAGIVAWLSFSVSPGGLAKAEALLSAQKSRGEFESLEGGKFYPLRGGRGVTYTESIDDDGTMHEVFLSQSSIDSSGVRQVVVLAEKGRPKRAEENGERYLVLRNGYRIEGTPGRADFQITAFDEYGQRLEKDNKIRRHREKAAIMSTAALRASDRPEHIAALQWRYSVPILVLVVSLMAVPLSRTNPRQGRFVKVFPAVLLYISYLVGLNAARGALEDGEISATLGLWWVHGVFLMIAASLLLWDSGWRGKRTRSSVTTVAGTGQ